MTDDRGDVLELLEADHIAFGAYRYDVYGRPTATTWRTTDTTAMDDSWMEPITAERSLLRYAGYSYDAHSELYYLQRRYYDAILRQFLSRDPLKSDGAESPYQYCGGNPVAGSDPWGLYVTASGERTNTWFRFPAGNVYGGNGNGDWYSRAPTGTGHRGAGRSSDTEPLARWRGSLGAGPMGVPSAQRLVSDFASDFAEWGRWFLGDPEADPLRDSNPVLAEHTYAALTALSLFLPTPAGKARAGTIAVRFVDDAVLWGAAGVRAARGVDVAARRVYLRVGTKDAIRASARRTADGRIVDEFSEVVIPQGGAFHYAHRPGLEWWRTQRLAREQGWTRRQLIEYENDWTHYYIADPYSNMSHRWESPR